MNLFLRKIVIGFCAIFMLGSTTQANVFKNFKKVATPFVNPLVFAKKNKKESFGFKVISSTDQTPIYQKYHALVDGLCKKLNMKKPTVYVYTASKKKSEINAVAFFDKNGAGIAFGEYLIQKWEAGWITDQEVEAGIAHELCHLKHNHLFKKVGVNLLVDGPLVFNPTRFFSYTPKSLIKNAFSRTCEKEADLKAINLIDDPLSLVRFLVKLHCLIDDFYFFTLNSDGQDKDLAKKGFEKNCETTEEKLIKDGDSFVAPLVELMQDHPLTANRIAYIKNGKK